MHYSYKNRITATCIWTPWLVRQAVDHVQARVMRAVLARDAGLIMLAVSLQGLFLYSRADTIYGGSNQIQRNVIGERVLGLPPEPRAGG